MVKSATLTTIGALETEIEADMAKLEAAILEAALVGFESRNAYSSCTAGWCPHDSESDWAKGMLLLWTRLDDG